MRTVNDSVPRISWMSFLMSLPARAVRKIAAMRARWLLDGVSVPRHIGSWGVAGLFCATAFYGVYAGGHGSNVMQFTTTTLGFAVEHIDVSGNQQTSEIDVLGALGLDGHTSMVGFNVGDAQARIEALPWVAHASLRKIYPGQVVVELKEREAFAIWQHDGEIDLVDHDGKIIVPYHPGSGSQLPLIVGNGAQDMAPQIMDKIAHYPHLAERVRAYIYVAGRRWDVVLDNGVQVSLPEAGIDQALTKLVQADREQNLLGRDIVSVDLRILDRMAVVLTPEAMERYNTMIETQKKQARALERRAA